MSWQGAQGNLIDISHLFPVHHVNFHCYISQNVIIANILAVFEIGFEDVTQDWEQ